MICSNNCSERNIIADFHLWAKWHLNCASATIINGGGAWPKWAVHTEGNLLSCREMHSTDSARVVTKPARHSCSGAHSVVGWRSIPTTCLPPAIGTLLPRGLHRLPSSGDAGIPGVSFSRTICMDIGILQQMGLEWQQLPDWSCSSQLLLEMPEDSVVPWELPLPLSA